MEPTQDPNATPATPAPDAGAAEPAAAPAEAPAADMGAAPAPAAPMPAEGEEHHDDAGAAPAA